MSKYKIIDKNREAENEASSISTSNTKSTSTEKHTIKKNASSTNQLPKSRKLSQDSDEIIPRRYGEGNKSLCAEKFISNKSSQKAYRGHNVSSSSSSPERYRRTEKNRNDQKKDRTIKSLSPGKLKNSKELGKIPYFADQKREEERLERKRKLSVTRKKGEYNRGSRSNKSLRNFRSRSQSRERSRHRERRRSSERYRRSRSKSYRRFRSRTRSRSRDKYRMRNAPYIHPMFSPMFPSVLIATPSTSDYHYSPQNWMPPILPITTGPPRFPYFGPIVTPFPPMVDGPPNRYPVPMPNYRYNPHATTRLPRTDRFKPPNRGFHRPRNP